MLLGPGVDQPALLPERLLPAHVVVADEVLAVPDLVADVGGQVGASRRRAPRRRISALQG